MSVDWKWGDEENKGAIVFPTVSAVAVYTNPRGDIVLRQEGSHGEDDSVIIIPRIHVGAVVNAMQSEFELES